MSGNARNDAGGRAASAGIGYQARVAAWLAVRVLAGRTASSMAALSNRQLVRIELETADPVNDVVATLGGGGRAAIQAKTKINAATAEGSELGKTLSQFVRHHADHPDDQLVLATTSHTSGKVKKNLRELLDRLRSTPTPAKLEDVARTESERSVLRVVRDHVKREHKAATGKALPNSDFEKLLRHVHVLVLDLDDDDTNQREARNLLSTSVVSDPGHSDTAWNTLTQECQRLAEKGGAADRSLLRHALTTRNIPLAGVADYWKDIDKLADRSAKDLSSLVAAATRIPTENGAVSIARVQSGQIARELNHASLLVVGDPGTGKSGLLANAAAAATPTFDRVVVLAVGDHHASSRGELRNELGLDHELLDVLANWTTGEPGVVVIDGLDAARTAEQAELWTGLVTTVAEALPGWHVLASIRRWDLQHNRRLRRALTGSTVEVNNLTDLELEQVTARSPRLKSLLSAASTDLTALLHNPFNLRLAAELLQDTDPAKLHAVTSQIQLLDLYWQERVTTGPEGTAQGRAATAVASLATKERALTVATADLDQAEVERLESLLSSGVLEAPGTAGHGQVTRVGFSHNILFDYALSICVIDAHGDGVRGFLQDDPDAVLFSRPSVDMSLHRTWDLSHVTMLDAAVGIAEHPDLRLATMAAAEVITTRLVDPTTLQLVVEALDDPTRAEAARRLVRYIVAAIAHDVSVDEPVDLEVWAGVAEFLSERVDELAHPLMILLTELNREPAKVPQTQSALGSAGRRLLDHYLDHPPHGHLRFALEVVVEAADTDPSATEALLRRILDPVRITEVGYHELPWLAEHVPALLQVLPDIVHDVYIAAWVHNEESTETTPFVPSGIMGMTSNRRQDFERSRYRLAEHYDDYLRYDPIRALRTLQAVIDLAFQAGESVTLVTDLVTAEVMPERFLVWDQGRAHDVVVKMAKKLADFLEDAEPAQLAAVVAELTANPYASALWRRVITSAATNRDLATELGSPARIALIDPDCGIDEEINTLLGSHAEQLTDDERKALEDALTQVLDSAAPLGEPEKGWLEARLLRRLHAIGLDNLRSERLRTFLGSKEVPPAPVRGVIASFESSSMLERLGLDEDDTELQKVWERIQPVDEFATEHLNDPPTRDQVTQVIGHFEALRGQTNGSGVPEVLVTYAEDATARAAEAVTRCADLTDDQVALVRTVLLEAATSPRPSAERWADNDSLTIPQGPRTEAAQGLWRLAARNADDEEVIQAAEQFVNDEIPYIRGRTAQLVRLRWRDAPERVWGILGDLGSDESDFVLHEVVSSTTWLLAHPPALDVLRAVTRSATKRGSETARAALLATAALNWIATGEMALHELYTDLLEDPDADEVSSLLHEVRDNGFMTTDDDDQRSRALSVLRDCTDLGLGILGDLSDLTTTDDGRIAELRLGARVLDAVAMQIYFASGAYQAGDDDEPSAADIRLFDEALEIANDLAVLPVAEATHHLVEFIVFTIDERPQECLETVHRLVTTGGQDAGYQTEPLGLRLVVDMVEQLLANHRSVIGHASCLTKLREMLEIFVEAGWPAARQLVFSLDRLFR